jgi:MinD superfamily P-loop ATPase
MFIGVPVLTVSVVTIQSLVEEIQPLPTYLGFRYFLLVMRFVSTMSIIVFTCLNHSGCETSEVRNFTEEIARARMPYRSLMNPAMPDADSARELLAGRGFEILASVVIAHMARSSEVSA